MHKNHQKITAHAGYKIINFTLFLTGYKTDIQECIAACENDIPSYQINDLQDPNGNAIGTRSVTRGLMLSGLKESSGDEAIINYVIEYKGGWFTWTLLQVITLTCDCGCVPKLTRDATPGCPINKVITTVTQWGATTNKGD